MSFASALNILRPTLPYCLALTKYDLLHIEKDSFEFYPNLQAPPIALEMARTVFSMGANFCIESFVMSRTLGCLLLAWSGVSIHRVQASGP